MKQAALARQRRELHQGPAFVLQEFGTREPG